MRAGGDRIALELDAVPDDNRFDVSLDLNAPGDGVIGALAIVVNICFAQAVKEADATTLMPFDFTKLVWAALLGYLVFGEVPEVWTWIGGAVIFAAAAGLTLRERGRDNITE